MDPNSGVVKRKMGMLKKRQPLPQEEMATVHAWTDVSPLRDAAQTRTIESSISSVTSESPSPTLTTSSPSSRSTSESLGDSKEADADAQNDGASAAESPAARQARGNDETDSSRASALPATAAAESDDPQRGLTTIGSTQGPVFEPTSKSFKSEVVSTVTSNVSRGTTVTSRHNTWITATTVLPETSVTIEPFASLLGGDGRQAVMSAQTVSSSLSPVNNKAQPLITNVEHPIASTITNTAEPALLASVGSAGPLAGISVATAFAAFVIVIAAIVYAKGGALRGLMTSWRPKRKAPLVDQNSENTNRRAGSSNETLRGVEDLEKASSSLVSEGVEPSHRISFPDDAREDTQEQWEEVDICDPRSGNMIKDNGEWLESWRQRKDALLKAQRSPPELKLDPAIPLPPLSFDAGQALYKDRL